MCENLERPGDLLYNPVSAARCGCNWNEVQDEAHSVSCVELRVPLPVSAKHAKELHVELRQRQLKVFVRGQTVLEDRFAEDGWLDVNLSYWEFLPGGGSAPELLYYLMKSDTFQNEPLYCLFESELYADTSDDDGENCPPKSRKPQAFENVYGSVRQSNPVSFHSKPCTRGSKSEINDDHVASEEPCGENMRDTIGSEIVDKTSTPTSESVVSAGGRYFVDSVKTATQCLCAGSKSETIDNHVASEESCGENIRDTIGIEIVDKTSTPTSESDVAADSRYIVDAVKTAARCLRAGEFSAGQNITIVAITWSDGQAETQENYRELLDNHDGLVLVSIACLSKPRKKGSVTSDRSEIRIFDGRLAPTATTLLSRHADAVLIPCSALLPWYYLWANVFCDTAFLESMVVVTTTSSLEDEIGRSVLNAFGCNILATISGMPSMIVAKGRNNNHSSGESAADTEGNMQDRAYLPLRQKLATIGVDFRPLYPTPRNVEVPSAASEAASRAWRSAGGSPLQVAVAAGVTAAEVVLVAMRADGCRGSNQHIQAAVRWSVRGVLKAGGAEYAAAAVGALLGMREGFFSWQRGCNLERHGVHVSNVVCATLAAEGTWSTLSSAIRDRKLTSLCRAGGIGRPGECTIALCQTLLGANRRRGQARLGAATAVLRMVSVLLLAEASLPNMLDVRSVEVAEFSAALFASLDWTLLSALLEAEDADYEVFTS